VEQKELIPRLTYMVSHAKAGASIAASFGASWQRARATSSRRASGSLHENFSGQAAPPGQERRCT